MKYIFIPELAFVFIMLSCQNTNVKEKSIYEKPSYNQKDSERLFFKENDTESLNYHSRLQNQNNNDSNNIKLKKGELNNIPCDVDIVLKTDNNIKDISYESTVIFLKTIQEECKTNIEFTEYSNEVLFKLLYGKTELVLKALNEKKNNKLDLHAIIYDISNPLLDYDGLIKQVSSVKKFENEKQLVISALKEASYQEK